MYANQNNAKCKKHFSLNVLSWLNYFFKAKNVNQNRKLSELQNQK